MEAVPKMKICQQVILNISLNLKFIDALSLEGHIITQKIWRSGFVYLTSTGQNSKPQHFES